MNQMTRKNHKHNTDVTSSLSFHVFAAGEFVSLERGRGGKGRRGATVARYIALFSMDVVYV